MSKPAIITSNKPLPFSELSPLEFERLSLWLIEREGYLRPQHLGEGGSEMGRDIIAFKSTSSGEELWYFQCKRYKRIDIKTLKHEVDKYNLLATSNSARRPAGIIFITSAAVSARVRDEVERYCRQYGYVCDFWARTELDMRVKKHPDIVAEFFAAATVATATALHQLPASPRDFTGRSEELDELLSKIEAGGVTLSGLRGMGGIGKTALALYLSERLTPNYPDAQFYLDLKGTSSHPLTSVEAMLHVVRAYNPGSTLPENEAEICAFYRSVLYGKRALLLMDNARDAAQVEALIPPPTCFLIVTSRKHFTLPGLFGKDLDVLTLQDACTLLLKIAPRIDKQADKVANLCGRLPLALRIAASALAEYVDLSVEEYVRRLAEASRRVRLIEASLSLSYGLLEPRTRKLWRMLSVFPYTFDIRAAATVWGVEPYAAQETLSKLVSHSMVEWDEATTRYRLHDLARIFADARINKVERHNSQKQFATHYLDVLLKSQKLYRQGSEALREGLKLLNLEWANIQAGQSWSDKYSAVSDDAASLCCRYPDFGAYVLGFHLRPSERVRWIESALAASRRIDDLRFEEIHTGNLGIAYAAAGQIRRAIELFEQVLAFARKSGNRESEANSYNNLGRAYSSLGDSRRAIEFLEQSLTISRELADRNGESRVLGSLGWAYFNLGEINRSIELAEQRLAIAREIGDLIGISTALGLLGDSYSELEDFTRAVEFHEQSLNIIRELGVRNEEPSALGRLGVTYSMSGELQRGIECFHQQLLIAREMEDLANEGAALCDLATTHNKLGNPQRAVEFYEQALVIFRQIGNRRSEADTLNGMSRALHAVGDIAQAISYAKVSLQIYEQIGHPRAAHMREKLGQWRDQPADGVDDK